MKSSLRLENEIERPAPGTRKTGKERNGGTAGEERDMKKRRRARGAGDKRQEQRSYERVPVRLTVRCRVVGARLAVSLSACQPTHVGTVATGLACRFTYRHLASQPHTRRALLHRAIPYTCGKRERVWAGTSPAPRPSLIAESRLSIRSFTTIY